MRQPKRVHIIGRKNSGKTTLIVELVRHFTATGLRVATIKHTHHQHELDTPGKDSFRHREAGADAVGILSPAMNAVFWPATDGDEASDRYDQFDALMSDCDLVLVEGHSQVDGIKVEVWRAENSEAPLARDDESIRAIISDDQCSVDVPVWSRADVPEIARQIHELT